MFILIIILLVNGLWATTFNGDFMYCESYSTNMALLDLSPMCSQAIFEKQKEHLINSTNEGTDFIVLRKVPKVITTKISVCTRVLSSLTSKWHLFKRTNYTFENKNLPVNDDECKDIRSRQCDVGNDPEKKDLRTMECLGSVCKTDLRPKKSYKYFKTYYDSVVNCFLEILEIDETSNSKISPYMKTNKNCVSAISCDDTILQCSCLSNDAHYHWSYEREQRISWNFELVQIINNIKVRDNTLYNEFGMPIFTIVNKTKETMWTIAALPDPPNVTKKPVSGLGIRDPSEMKRFKRQKGNAQRNKLPNKIKKEEDSFKDIEFELYHTTDMTLITNDRFIMDWAKENQITLTNISIIPNSLEHNATFKFRESFNNMKTFFANGMKIFNQDEFNFIINNTKLLREANDRSFCFVWKTSLNIFSQLENEFNILEDFAGGKYILYSKFKKIWVPKCSRINEIGFEVNKIQRENNKCYKDLPVVFFRTDHYGKNRKAHKGFINSLGIIHHNREKVSCENIDQLFIFPVQVNNNYSVLSITRRALDINFSLVLDYLNDFVDPFDFSRNHFKYKLENILQDKVELSDLSSILDFNQTKVFIENGKITTPYTTGLEYLVLVPFLTILTNLILFCIYSCCKKIKDNSLKNQNYEFRMRMYKNY